MGSVIASLIAFVLLGVIAGYLGRLVMPGGQQTGLLATVALGMAGAVLGGVLGSLISGEGLQLGTAGLLGSILGVLAALVAIERLGRLHRPGADRGAHRA